MAYSGSTNVNYLGMDLDSSPFRIKEGFYTYMLNGVLSTVDGYLFNISNAPSNKNTFNIPNGFYITGSFATYKTGEFFVSICNPTTSQSRIALLDLNANTYVEYINNSNIDLNFKLTRQVEGEYKETLNCKKFLYITDDLNKMRYLDVTEPMAFNEALQEDDISIFPNYYVGNPVCINIQEVTNGGGLMTGAYQFEIQYADVAGNEITAPMAMTGIISIYKGNTTSGWAAIEGSPPNVPANKSITIAVSNLNTNIDYYNLIMIETINGVTSAYIVGTFPTTQFTYTVDGFETKKQITLQQAYKVSKFYKKAKTITTTNSYLLWGNLEGGNTPNLQRLVTDHIYLYWQDFGISYDDLFNDYKNPTSSAYRKSYLRDEVYAFGISFTLLDGQETAVFHIPGRDKNQSNNKSAINNQAPKTDSYGFSTYGYTFWDDAELTNLDSNNVLKERWEIYNTATVSNGTFGYSGFPISNDPAFPENLVGCKRKGDFSYFECQTEYPLIKDCTDQYVYPEGKIRHHKFPDCNISPIYDTSYGPTDLSYLNDLGFNFDPLGTPVPTYLYFNSITDAKITKFPVTINLLGIELPEDSINNFYDAVNDEITNYPDLQGNPIVGYNLYSSDRSVDKTIVAKGQIFNSREYTDSDTAQNFHFQNFPFNPLVINPTSGATPYSTTYGGAPVADPNRPGSPMYLMDLTYKLDFSTASNHSKQTFDFWSPSTTFNIAPLNVASLKIEQSNFGQGYTEMVEVNKHSYTTESSSDYNPALILIGDGNYDSKTILNSGYLGSINYLLDDCIYVNTNGPLQLNQAFSYPINNSQKPPIVHLKSDRNIIDPTVIEGTSTFYYYSTLEFGFQDVTDSNGAYRRITRDSLVATVISAQYVALKNDNASPYGDLTSVQYNRIDKGCYGNDCNIIFGGDTFITNFSFKKSHSYFNEFNNDWPYDYTGSSKENFPGPLTVGRTNDKGKMVQDISTRYYQDGSIEKFLLACNTMNTFFCESEVNTELRYTEEEPYTKFTPNYYWKTIINLDVSVYPNWNNIFNSFLYNQDYSKSFDNKPYYILNNLQLEDCSFCSNVFDNRVIYSQKSSQEELVDDWLIYPAGNYYDFPKKAGEVWSLKAVGQDRLFTRCTRSAFIQLANQTLQASAGSVELKSVELFNPEPRELITVDGGFLGTRSQWAYNSTPTGSYYVDIDNFSIFSFDGNSPKSLSAMGISQWANNNLGLKILEDYPDFPNTDNPANPFTGVGYTSVWDPANQLWYITKKDYKLKKVRNSGGNIVIPEYSAEDDTFYIGPLNDRTKVTFKDTTYFSDQSFTLSYSPLTNSFISFYSFTPNGYLHNKNKFNSYTDNSLFEHNIRGSFTNYYNTQFEHIIEYVSKLDTLVSTKRSIQWRTQSFSFSNDNNTPYENQFDTYYKAIVYNNEQITGVLNLIPPTTSGTNNLLNLSNINNYPTINSNSVNVQIQQTTNDRIWKLSELWDRCGNRTTDNPLFTNNFTNTDFIAQYPIDKVINQNAVNYNKDWYNIMRMDNYCKVRLFYNQEDKQLINILSLSKDKVINS